MYLHGAVAFPFRVRCHVVAACFLREREREAERGREGQRGAERGAERQRGHRLERDVFAPAWQSFESLQISSSGSGGMHNLLPSIRKPP